MRTLINLLILFFYLNIISINSAQADEYKDILDSSQEAENSENIKQKLMLRGKNEGIKVIEFRYKLVNDVMVVQADLKNTIKKDLVAFYRFYWTDAAGNQVGDNEVWKQVVFYGEQQRTLKGTGTSKGVVDFRLEINVEPPK